MRSTVTTFDAVAGGHFSFLERFWGLVAVGSIQGRPEFVMNQTDDSALPSIECGPSLVGFMEPSTEVLRRLVSTLERRRSICPTCHTRGQVCENETGPGYRTLTYRC